MAGQAKSASDGTGKAEPGLLVPLVLLLVLGGGAGFGYGILFGGSKEPAAASAAKTSGMAAPSHVASEADGKMGADWHLEELVALQPLIVRINGDTGKWLRLEGAVAFARSSKEDRGPIVAQLGEDLMLFLGSLRLEQVGSPTGLEFLRDDMNDIVQLRTRGQAKRFVLKSLVVE